MRRACRTERIERAREAYIAALNAWFDDSQARRWEADRASSDLLTVAREELFEALDEAGVKRGPGRPIRSDPRREA